MNEEWVAYLKENAPELYVEMSLSIYWLMKWDRQQVAQDCSKIAMTHYCGPDAAEEIREKYNLES